MEIKKAEFLTTVADSSKLIKNLKNEFAFVGRSNVGKSSLINALTNQSKLAKTSSTPGKTKLINYFKINNGEFYIVDLPGYGYHKASKEDEKKWTKLIEDYLSLNENLKCVFSLIDVRHEASPLDLMMINFLVYYRVPFVVILNKIDKLSRNELDKQVSLISKQLGIPKDNLILSSGEKKLGIKEIISKIEHYKD